MFDPSLGAYGQWFAGGMLNTCHNALDRHVNAGRAEQTALIWDSAMEGRVVKFTYRALRDRVAKFAGALRALGVARGDCVVIYMPMVPEAAIAMLACARLGAIHSVVFGGFASNEVAKRIEDATPKVIVTASCGLEPGRVVPYLPLLNGAIAPALLMNLGLASARASERTLSFLGEDLAGAGSGGERTLARSSLHDGSIRTLSLRFERPFTWAAFSAALELLTTLRGPDLLRVKGIVNVEGKPVVVQGVQHVFHDPVPLDHWPSADTGTRLVFITRRIEAQVIRNLLQAVADAA